MATTLVATCILLFTTYVHVIEARPSALDVLLARPSAIVYGFEHNAALSGHRRGLLQTVSEGGTNGTKSISTTGQQNPASPSPPASPTPSGKATPSGLFSLPVATDSTISGDGSDGSDASGDGTQISGNSTSSTVNSGNSGTAAQVTVEPYSDCSVFTANAALKCTGQVPIPACCDDTGNCYSNSNGIGGTCRQASPLPGCCKAVDRLVEQCTVSAVGQNTLTFSSICTGAYPVTACCNTGNSTAGSGTCHVNADMSTPDCPASAGVHGCCPA